MDEDLELAELLVRRNLIDREVLLSCMREQGLGEGAPKTLGQIIIEKGILSRARLEEFLQEIRSSPGREPEIATYYCHSCGGQYRVKPKPGARYRCKQCSGILSDSPKAPESAKSAPAPLETPVPAPVESRSDEPTPSPAPPVSNAIIDEITRTLANIEGQGLEISPPAAAETPPARRLETPRPPSASPVQRPATQARSKAPPPPPAAKAGALDADWPQAVREAGRDPSRRLGSYVLVEAVARGSLGEVWKAYDTKNKRFAAVKILENLPEDELRRLRRESENCLKLEHPDICQIWEVGQQGSRSFISMQFVEGASLRDKRLGLRQAIAAAAQAARALDYAHAKGFIHRDIKPSNLMIDADGKVTITDFGIVRPMSATLRLKHVGEAIFGTPGFLSPEQAMGRLDEVGPPSDVFSLAATLYFMITGEEPFFDRSTLEMIRKVVQDEPVPPSRRNPIAQISPELDRIVMKGLAKDKAARYRSASDLANDLESWLQAPPEEALAAAPPSEGARSKKRKLVLAAGLAIPAAAGVVLWLWKAADHAGERDREDTFRKEATAFESEVSRLAQQEQFRKLFDVLAGVPRRSLSARWTQLVKSREDEIRNLVQVKFEDLKRKAIASPEEAPAIRKRVAGWGLAELAQELERALLESASKDLQTRFQTLLAAEDFRGAGEELKKAEGRFAEESWARLLERCRGDVARALSEKSRALAEEAAAARKRGAEEEVRKFRERVSQWGSADAAAEVDKALLQADTATVVEEIPKLVKAQEFVQAEEYLRKLQGSWSTDLWAALLKRLSEQVSSARADAYQGSRKEALEAFRRGDGAAVSLVRVRVARWGLAAELDRDLWNAGQVQVEAETNRMLAEERFGAALQELDRARMKLDSTQWTQFVSSQAESVKKAARERFAQVKAEATKSPTRIPALRERVSAWRVDPSIADPAELRPPAIKTPAVPPIVTASKSGAIVLDGPKAHLVGQVLALESAVSLSYGDAAEWIASVAEGGRFAVEIRFSAGAGEGGPFVVMVGACRLTGFARPTEGSLEMLSLGPLALPKGDLVVSIRPLQKSLLGLSSVTLVPRESALSREASEALWIKGTQEYEAGEYDKASASFTKVYEGSPDAEATARAAYRLACVFSQGGDQASATDWLEAAGSQGIGSAKDGACHATMWEHLKAEPALEKVRATPRFQAFLKKYAP